MKTLKEAGQKRHPWADFFKPVSEHEKDGKLIIFSGEMSKKSRFEEIAPPRGEITGDSLIRHLEIDSRFRQKNKFSVIEKAAICS